MLEDKKKYEISVMLKTEEAFGGFLELLKSHRAVIQEENKSVKVRLAYPIKKETVGYFAWVVAECELHQIAKLEYDLGTSPDVLRSLIVTPPIGKRVEREGGYGPRYGAVSPRPQRSAPIPQKKEVPAKSPEPVLSNELLEKKLEEILK